MRREVTSTMRLTEDEAWRLLIMIWGGFSEQVNEFTTRLPPDSPIRPLHDALVRAFFMSDNLETPDPPPDGPVVAP